MVAFSKFLPIFLCAGSAFSFQQPSLSLGNTCNAHKETRLMSIARRQQPGMDEDEVSPEAGKVSYAGRIEKDKGPQYNFRDQYEGSQDGIMPTTYEGFVDGEEFDGGDGQMGVVGDGQQGLDKSDFNAAQVVKQQTRPASEPNYRESKMRKAEVAWGFSSGYADQLAEKGMVDIDQETGEDRLKVRRQQLENWKSQQEVKSMRRNEMMEQDVMDGTSYASDIKKGARFAHFANLEQGNNAGQDDDSWRTYSGPAGSVNEIGKDWGPLTDVRARDRGSVDVVAVYPKPGFVTLPIANNVMTYEPFRAAFLTHADKFEIKPASGTLDRRGDPPLQAQIVFKPEDRGAPVEGILIIETEEMKIKYTVKGITQ